MLDTNNLNFIVCRANPAIGKQSDKIIMSFHDLSKELNADPDILKAAMIKSNAIDKQMKWNNDDGTFYIIEKSIYNTPKN